MSRKQLVLGIVVCVLVIVVVTGYFTITTLTRPEKPGLRCVCTGGCKVCEALWVESYDWKDLSLLTVRLRNLGPSPVFFKSVSVNGLLPSSLSGDCMSYFDIVKSDGLPPSQSCTLEIQIDATAFTNGNAYPLRITTATEGIFSFPIVAGKQT